MLSKLYTIFFLIGYSGKVKAEGQKIENGMRSLQLLSFAFWMPINIISIVGISKLIEAEKMTAIVVLTIAMLINFITVEKIKEKIYLNAKNTSFSNILTKLTETNRLKLALFGFLLLIFYWLGSISIFNFIINPI